MKRRDLDKVIAFLFRKKISCLFCPSVPVVFKHVREINPSPTSEYRYDNYFLCKKHKDIDMTAQEVLKFMYFLEEKENDDRA